MEVIENFAALSEKEQREFAEALVKTVNSESSFIDRTTFEVVAVEADDLTGDLIIEVSHDPLIEVRSKAVWYCGNEEQAEEDPRQDADYDEALTIDAEKSFKTLSTEIDGYTVSLEVEDADDEEFIEVEVDELTHEDDGVGSYEYWGYTGYDSRPYVAVEGTIVSACKCALVLFVEPTAKPEPVDAPDEE